MMKIIMDGNKITDKNTLLMPFFNAFEEMYSANFDALFDVLSFCKESVVIEIINEEKLLQLEIYNVFCNVLKNVLIENKNIEIRR